MALSNEEIHRYARHIILPEVGGRGQLKLKNAHVLVAGLGPTGAFAALYLAAAGVGRIDLYDPEEAGDGPDLLRWEGEAGARSQSAAAKLRAINPAAEVHVVDHPVHHVDRSLTVAVVTCRLAPAPGGVPIVVAGTQGKIGAVTVIAPEARYAAGQGGEQAAAVVPDAPDADPAAAGVIGSAAATEAIKLMVGAGRPLTDRVLRYDALIAQFRTETK